MRHFIILAIVFCANLAFSQNRYILRITPDGQASLSNGKSINLPDEAFKALYKPRKEYYAFETAEGLLIGSSFEFCKVNIKKMTHEGRDVNYLDSIYMPVNYVLLNGKFSRYEALDGYVLYDYNQKKNTALVGQWNPKLTFADRKVQVVCNYGVLTHKFNNHISHTRVVWRAVYLQDGDSIKTTTDKNEAIFANK